MRLAAGQLAMHRNCLLIPAPVLGSVQIPIPGAGTVVPECEKPPKPCSKGEVRCSRQSKRCGTRRAGARLYWWKGHAARLH